MIGVPFAHWPLLVSGCLLQEKKGPRLKRNSFQIVTGEMAVCSTYPGSGHSTVTMSVQQRALLNLELIS